MFKLRLVSLFVFLMLLVGSISAQEGGDPIVIEPVGDPIVIEPIPLEGQGYCNVYTTSVYIPNFDPTKPNESLRNIVFPEPIFGGCYATLAEALYVGSAGSIVISENATAQEIEQAINAYHPVPRTTDTVPETWQEAALSSTLYAIGYDGTGYSGYSFQHWDYAGLNCPVDYWYFLNNYDSYGWNDRFESFAGRSNCDDMFLYRDTAPWSDQSPLLYVHKFSSNLEESYHGNYRNWISGSIIGDWSATYWP